MVAVQYQSTNPPEIIRAVSGRIRANYQRPSTFAVNKPGPLGERLVESFDPAAFDLLDPTEDTSELARAFAALSESDRELLSLEAWEGLTREEIAVALGTNRATVRLRLHRARRRLRDALAPTQTHFTGGTEHEWT